MITTTELFAAVKALDPKFHGLLEGRSAEKPATNKEYEEYEAAKSERATRLAEYKSEVASLEAQWKLYLAATYLPNATPATVDVVYDRTRAKTKRDGSANFIRNDDYAGFMRYDIIEGEFADLAEFASVIIAAEK